MATPYDVTAQELIDAASAQLAEEYDDVDQPDWSRYVKTGVHKERPPRQDDWWYTRSAAVLRTVYLDGPVGVARLRRKYGGKQRRGHQTEHKQLASGKVIRTVLQQLEEAGLVATEEGEGRAITPDGQRFLDNLSHDLINA